MVIVLAEIVACVQKPFGRFSYGEHEYFLLLNGSNIIWVCE